MEIDDLQKNWDEGFTTGATPGSILEIIVRQKNSPLTVLEKKTKFAIWIFPFAGLLFAGTFIDHSLARHSPVIWLLLFILFAEFVFSLLNLSIIKKIQNGQGNVRKNLASRIKALGKGFKQFLIFYISLYVLMVMLLEITMYYHADMLFDGWHQTSALIRAIAYVFALAVIYQAKRYSQQEQYGNYLAQLKAIADQLD